MSPGTYAVLVRFSPLGLLGRLAEAGEAIRRGMELAGEYGELEFLSLGLTYPVTHGGWSGETDTVLADAREGVEIAERRGAPFFVVLSLGALGDALRLEQRHPEALEAYDQALELIRTKRVGVQWEPHVVGGQALAYSALGEHEKAIALARSALEESLRGGNRRAEDFALPALARILLTTGDPDLHDEVERTVERGEALCEETGIRVHRPCLRELWAALAERRGDSQEARQSLREAHRLYAEIGATGHAERLAAELDLRGNATRLPLRPVPALPDPQCGNSASSPRSPPRSALLSPLSP